MKVEILIMIEFENKVALITGGSGGIGKATAIAFANKGAKVVIASRREKESYETLDLVKNAGGEGIFIKTDVNHAVEIENLIEQTIANYGRLDYAFNNAGIEGKLIPFTEYAETDWDEVMNVNLKSVWLSMKYEVPAMLKSGGGVIINNASILGSRGMAYCALYSASKHGVIGLTKSVALEQAKTGIRVNCVCPGAIETDMIKRAFDDEIKAQIVSKYPMGRLGQPEEVANAVIWLCSDHASFITGHCLEIDGGYMA